MGVRKPPAANAQMNAATDRRISAGAESGRGGYGQIKTGPDDKASSGDTGKRGAVLLVPGKVLKHSKRRDVS